MPLHKSGNINKVENYRGITLLSVLAKLFTSVINKRLNNWAENYNVYTEGQTGFRSGYSTVDNIFVLKTIIDHFNNSGKKLYTCFIDFRKAFDYVSRTCLWYKLIKMGLRGNILNIIQSMYSQVISSVRDPVTHNLSAEFECKIGLRQGESLSPFLFAMYINDLEEILFVNNKCGVNIFGHKVSLLLYADDAVILADSKEGLQASLDELSIYIYILSKLEFNPKH